MINIYDYVFLGEDIPINEKISIHLPTLKEVFKFGEQRYYAVVHFFTSTPTDLKVQLDSIGLDWNKVDEWDCFYSMIFPAIQNVPEYLDVIQFLLPTIDVKGLKRAFDNETNEQVIINDDASVRIDVVVYNLIVDAMRQVHYQKKNVAHAMNESTRKWMIEDDKDEIERAQREGFKSQLASLVSSMVNSAGFKYNYTTALDLDIFLFMDAVKRTLKIDGYKNLMTGVYTGNVDSKKINKKEFNWLANLSAD